MKPTNLNDKSQQIAKTKTAINPTRADDYPEWYQQVIKAADLAETSVVRGCMIMKPWGYAIWENMQRVLDTNIKATGAKNVYFPLLIPVSFLEKEAAHIEGFAKECAVVTHTRLVKGADGKLIPGSPLEDAYIIRPTSETIIGEAFSRWVQSYRDLPMQINQWANVMRWEMRTRMFLRTSEFLWQEGHTVHATQNEAQAQTLKILDLYADFAENTLAIPVIKGEKSASERFPGADATYTIEAMMQDNKALQTGTSHNLGQNFSRACGIKYLTAQGQEEFGWTTSWGVSTRMMGGLIMTHSDDNGLILPPRIAPLHVVILPISHKEEQKNEILTYCETVAGQLRAINYCQRPILVEIDQRAMTGGEKAWSWVKKGVPFRIEIGMKECQYDALFVGRRDQDYQARKAIPRAEFMANVVAQLDELQAVLLTRARAYRAENTVSIATEKDFYAFFTSGKGGFAMAHWNGDPAIEAKIKQELNVTIRCIPLLPDQAEAGTCIFSGAASPQQVVFAKAY